MIGDPPTHPPSFSSTQPTHPPTHPPKQVDIYAFGMSILQMVTKRSPYQECEAKGGVSPNPPTHQLTHYPTFSPYKKQHVPNHPPTHTPPTNSPHHPLSRQENNTHPPTHPLHTQVGEIYQRVTNHIPPESLATVDLPVRPTHPPTYPPTTHSTSFQPPLLPPPSHPPTHPPTHPLTTGGSRLH